MARLNRSLDCWNLAVSCSSLAKALAVRIPEMADSSCPLIPAMFCFTRTDARTIRRRWMTVKITKMGTMANTMRASFHWMVSIRQKAPMRVTAEMNRSSGPWWASSVISKRSLVARLMSCPVRFLS